MTIIQRKLSDRRPGKTDWSRVAATTDDDINKAIKKDPDAAPNMTVVYARADQRQSLRARVKQIRALLAEEFPAVFYPEKDRRPRKVLSLGIRGEIINSGFMKKYEIDRFSLSAALADITSGARYLTALAPGIGNRHNLHGVAVEPISAEHAQYAAEKLASFPEGWLDKMRIES